MRESQQLAGDANFNHEGEIGRQSSRLQKIIFAVVFVVLMVAVFSSRRTGIDKRSAVLLAKSESAPSEDGTKGSLAMGVRPNIWDENDPLNRAEDGQFPFVVAIRDHIGQGSDKDPHCTGILIAYDTVLTAAHCLWNKNATPPAFSKPNELQVLAGTVAADEHSRKTDYLAPKAMVLSRAVVPYPDFESSGRKQYDVGIIILASRIDPVQAEDGTYEVNYAVLPQAKDTPLPAQKQGATGHFYAVGFGEDKDEYIDYRLRFDFATPIPDADCSALYPTQYAAHSSFCVKNPASTAGAPKGVICSGDSGGPLVLVEPPGTRNSQVWGVASTGIYETIKVGVDDKELCQPKPGMYERVSFFLEWIEATQKQYRR